MLASKASSEACFTGPRQVRPYSATDPLTEGVWRGRLLFEAVSAIEPMPRAGVLLDVGCGYGGLSIAWAEAGGTAIALDADLGNLAIVARRLREGEPSGGGVRMLAGSALELPLKERSVDVVLAIGVVEWVGYSNLLGDVRALQLRALREMRRILRPGGLLVVGTKNRLFPRYQWRDGQTKLPLVNALPRRIADFLAKRWTGMPYRGHVYTFWGWQHLIRDAGFQHVRVLVPVFTYQFPLALLKPWSRVNLDAVFVRGTALPAEVKTAAFGGHSERRSHLRTAYYRLLGALGLLGVGAGCFLIIGRKVE
jgi:SAM-dependent methyltransferase